MKATENHLRRPLRKARSGFSLVEAVVSMAIGSMAVGGAMLLNAHQLRLVKSTRESSAAIQTIQERIEDLRNANWKQITDPAYLSGTYFTKFPKSVAPLDRYWEKITVSAWPDPSVCNKLIVEKSQRTSALVLLSGAGLADRSLARVDVQLTWVGKDRRARTREMSTVISNGGISRMHLPLWNTTAWEAFATPAPATPAPTGGVATPAPGTGGVATPAPEVGSGATPVPDGTVTRRGTISRPRGKK